MQPVLRDGREVRFASAAAAGGVASTELADTSVRATGHLRANLPNTAGSIGGIQKRNPANFAGHLPAVEAVSGITGCGRLASLHHPLEGRCCWRWRWRSWSCRSRSWCCLYGAHRFQAIAFANAHQALALVDHAIPALHASCTIGTFCLLTVFGEGVPEDVARHFALFATPGGIAGIDLRLYSML